MKNHINDGDTISYTAGANIASGDIVIAGHTICVAVTDIANGSTGTLKTKGRFTAPKVSGAVFVAGEKLVWDSSAGAFDDSSASPADGDITGGAIAAAAGGNGETTCEVILTPGNTTLTAT